MHGMGVALSLIFLLFVTCLSLLSLMALWQEHKRTALLLARSETENGEQRRQLAQLSRIVVLGELSGGLAHEINQPLTAILVNTEAALRSLQHESIDAVSLREILDDILTSDRHAIGIVQRLRSLLHGGETQHLPLDLNEETLSAVTLARSELVRRRTRIETKLESHLAYVNGDHVQVQQVILNLIVNACEAMADVPPVQRHLLLTTCDGPGSSEIQLSISDCGVGIEPPQLEKVFQPFVTAKPDGLGLGLSISRAIIRAHGGRIWAEHAPVGTVFRFTLPKMKNQSAVNS